MPSQTADTPCSVSAAVVPKRVVELQVKSVSETSLLARQPVSCVLQFQLNGSGAA